MSVYDATRSTRRRRAALITPLVLVNLVAVYGQFHWALKHLPGGVLVALLFAATLESIALYLSVEANAALLADDASSRLRLGAYLMGLGVGVLNYWHWSPDWTPTATAVTFGVLSTLSPFLWAIHSRRTHRNILAERRLIDPRTVRFTLAQWLHYPTWTFGAFRRAVWTRVTDPDTARAEYVELRAGTARPLGPWDVIFGLAVPLTVASLSALDGAWHLVIIDAGLTATFWAWRRLGSRRLSGDGLPGRSQMPGPISMGRLGGTGPVGVGSRDGLPPPAVGNPGGIPPGPGAWAADGAAGSHPDQHEIPDGNHGGMGPFAPYPTGPGLIQAPMLGSGDGLGSQNGGVSGAVPSAAGGTALLVGIPQPAPAGPLEIPSGVPSKNPDAQWAVFFAGVRSGGMWDPGSFAEAARIPLERAAEFCHLWAVWCDGLAQGMQWNLDAFQEATGMKRSTAGRHYKCLRAHTQPEGR